MARDWEPTLAELEEALELYNDNTDGDQGGEDVAVFVWPPGEGKAPEGGAKEHWRTGEWQLMDMMGERKARQHQREYGGRYAIVRIPGHNKPFNALRAASEAMKELGIRIMNPDINYVDGMFVRYIGDATIMIAPHDNRDYVYHGWVEVPGGSWHFDDLGASPQARRTMAEDSPDLIDRLAASAVTFGSDKGENPDSWQEVEEATAWAMDDRGSYEVHRVRRIDRNPAGLTAKGERMYEHVKRSYAGDPRAKEIASRTVLARAKGGARGLRSNPKGYWAVQGNYGYHGWEDVTAEESRSEALQRLREYRENEPGVPFRVVHVVPPRARRNPVAWISVGARVEIMIDQPGRQARLTEGTVVELDGDQALIRVDGGREVWLPQNRLRPLAAEAER